MKRTPLFVLLALMAAVAAPAQRQRDRSAAWERQPSVLRTSGTATVKAAPDEARLSVGVVTRAATAEEAASQNARQVAQVIATLRAEIGSAGEIETGNYSIYPDYGMPARDGGQPKIDGYRAQNMLDVRITDISKVGPIIDAAAKSGSNQIHGVSFGIQDETELRAKALQEAVRKARANADALAAALGVKVRRIVAVEEGGPTIVQPYRRAMADMAMASEAKTSIEPGEVEVQASVTMTVEFDQPVN